MRRLTRKLKSLADFLWGEEANRLHQEKLSKADLLQKEILSSADRNTGLLIHRLEELIRVAQNLNQELVSEDLIFKLWQETGRYKDPKSISRFDSRVYSQNGEDGIIGEIFRRIGTSDRFFVEIGIENGQQNNTRLLLEQGWRGVWFEGNEASVASASETFAQFIEAGSLKIVQAMVTTDNVNELFEQAGVPRTFDFLSLDIDHNTSHVWRALTFRSRVGCLEYNAALPPSVAAEASPDPAIFWTQTNWYGASLKALEMIGRDKGLKLVGCDINGVNAFFVSDEFADHFPASGAAEDHYEPMRLHRIAPGRGHPPSTVARTWI
ncbi:hypothetical protein [Microvirga sp. KLBC 81]|uniref:hypothetical protein n=1 Tax=Microvirga sp. KLBC 81 TaxID=1862707 RepID=UPI00105790B5|nr:hypothetical protein [Microvirga sp. KLBC 81]